MAANKLIQQPDILNLDSLGAFMDAQNDPIPTVSEEKEVTTAEETASDTEGEEIVQNEKSEVAQVDTTPQRPKVARTRRGKQTNVQPVIEAGSGEWDMMVRYAEFYNDNPDETQKLSGLSTSSASTADSSTSAISSMQYAVPSSSGTRNRSSGCRRTRGAFFDM